MENKFIKTFDKETAEKLQNLGFQKITSNSENDVFVNNNTLKFSDEIDISKIKYTNILCI